MPPSPSHPLHSGTSNITRGHSCALCQQRKVKCDRQRPCSNCTKARVECTTAPAQPRRRRKKLTETDLTARLQKYERLLKGHGVKIDEDDSILAAEPAGSPEYEFKSGSAQDATRPRVVEMKPAFPIPGGSRYTENNLWQNLRDEIQDPRDALEDVSSDDELQEQADAPPLESMLVATVSSSKYLLDLHPTPVQIFRLWQTFLTNVNPVIKMFHAPTIQQMILDASSDLAKIPRHTEALMFAIYHISVTSLQDEDCKNMFGEPRSRLLERYSRGTQQALVNSRFLKSLNIITLQALVYYLMACRRTYDPQSLWILSGVAIRISKRLGLHRDRTNHNISPFDAEIRRRTWWQIVFLDGQSTKIAGAGFPEGFANFEVQGPLNISDSDLSPGMRDPPKAKEGATEMMFCCLKYETGQAFLKASALTGIPWEGAPQHSSVAVTGKDKTSEKVKAIDELEALFERKFLRYCDPSIPLHMLTAGAAKSVICAMRIMAHHPRQYPDKGASMLQKEKDAIFAQSLQLLEIDSLSHDNKSTKGFLWHVAAHFQVDAFIYILSELKYRTSGEAVERAWRQVDSSFLDRPEILHNSKNSLYRAIGNLTLKAWQAYEAASGQFQVPPRFISTLRSQRNIPDPPRWPLPAQSQPANQMHNLGSGDMMQPANSIPLALPYDTTVNQAWQMDGLTFDMNMPEITPADWEYWQTLMDGDLPAFQIVDNAMTPNNGFN